MSSRPRILVAGSDPALRAQIAAAVAAHGEIVERESVRAVLSAAGGADVLVLDDGLAPDSLELVGRLREAEGLPVLFLTDRARVAAALAGGCADVVARPVDPGEVAARLGALLARREHSQQRERFADELRGLHKVRQVLAALVVHDLRNPISAIQGNVDLVREFIEDADPMIADCLRDIRELTDKALSLVASLLDVEEIEEGLLRADIKTAPVRPCVEQAALSHHRTFASRDIRFDLDVAEDLIFDFDTELTSRLLENLLDNAVRYAPRGGRVVARARRDGQGALVLRVGNDGPPIPDEEIPKIFDRYYRIEARRAGARANRGLGLYFCRLAAEVQGGTIRVIGAEDDLRAIFEVTLPPPSRG